MKIFGPLSSIFDITCFVVLYFVFGVTSIEQQTLFHTFWFAFGILSQALIIFVIRSKHSFSVKNMPSKVLIGTSLSAVAVTLLFVLTPLAESIELQVISSVHLMWVFGIVAAYLITTSLFKKFVFTPIE